jgi:hypothetical protein
VKLATALVLAALIAGCGSSSTTTSPHPPGPPETTTTSSKALPPACAHRARAMLAATAAEPFKASNGAQSCRLGGPRGEALVHLDSAPQPYFRMDREQTEFWQNVEWSHQAARAAPYPITSLGLGGYWFPLQHRLLTTDGVRLITIKLRLSDPAASKSLATRLAQVYLGPLVKPAGY